MSHMSSYTRGASRSGHSQNEVRSTIIREPTRAEYIALTLAEEARTRSVPPRAVTLRKFSWQ